jgi:hypothetical protein
MKRNTISHKAHHYTGTLGDLSMEQESCFLNVKEFIT